MASSAEARHIRQQYALRMEEWLRRELDTKGKDAGYVVFMCLKYLQDEKHL